MPRSLNRKVGKSEDQLAIEDVRAYLSHRQDDEELVAGLFDGPEHISWEEAQQAREEAKREFAMRYPEPEGFFPLLNEFECNLGWGTVVYADRREGSLVWDVCVMHWGAVPEKIYDDYGDFEGYEYPQDKFIIVAGCVLDVIIGIYREWMKEPLYYASHGNTYHQKYVEELRIEIAELEQVKRLRRLAWECAAC